MPIKVTCSCGKSFNAKHELAGKRVRCPQCKEPIAIPNVQDPDELQLEAPINAPKYNPLDDILNEEGVKATPTGPTCPSCAEPIQAEAIVCIECGFNISTGEKMSTFVEEDEDDAEAATAGMSETEKMLYKAEREIEDTPISADGEKFGDEGESYIIAIGAIVLVSIIVGVGVYAITLLDDIEDFPTTLVSAWMSVLFALGSLCAITITAFKERPRSGYLCLCVPFLYQLFYSATRGLYVSMGILILFTAIAVGCFSFGGGSMSSFFPDQSNMEDMYEDRSKGWGGTGY